MRVRSRHAWGAVLIVLFALPVLRPDGIPALERPIADTFSWFAGVTALNPHLWGSASVHDDPGTADRRLQEENAVLRESYASQLDLAEDLRALAQAFGAQGRSGLDRLPQALVARVLRTTDPADYRRSLLIDRGAEDGLERGLAVVSGRVLVGVVEVVNARSALVKLVTDRRSRLEVAVRTDANERLTGYVRGHGRAGANGDLDVRFVFAPEGKGRIRPGAPIFTSNADLLVPPQLIVGYVTEVSDANLDGIPRLGMRPALDLARSAHVFVLLSP